MLRTGVSLKRNNGENIKQFTDCVTSVIKVLKASNDVLGSSSFRELMKENTTQHERVKIGDFPHTPDELKHCN